MPLLIHYERGKLLNLDRFTTAERVKTDVGFDTLLSYADGNPPIRLTADLADQVWEMLVGAAAGATPDANKERAEMIAEIKKREAAVGGVDARIARPPGIIVPE